MLFLGFHGSMGKNLKEIERNGERLKKIGEKLKKIGEKVEIIRRNRGKNWMMTKHDKQTNATSA